MAIVIAIVVVLLVVVVEALVLFPFFSYAEHSECSSCIALQLSLSLCAIVSESISPVSTRSKGSSTIQTKSAPLNPKLF